MIITVKIGEGVVNYVIKATRAPRAYDGFGTFTVQDGLPDKARLVAVREEHLNWQGGRYGSGVGTAMYELEGVWQDDVVAALWRKLTNPAPQEGYCPRCGDVISASDIAEVKP